MPYIKNDERFQFNDDKGPGHDIYSGLARDIFRPTSKGMPETPGELNYQITCLIKDYIETGGRNYGVFNDILGALEGAKLEFYRRVVAPYENDKIEENGDVY